jgi:predicted DNA-binding protein YlxM (UPF0122 family)
MGYNYGYETKKFNAAWEKISRECAAAGMSESDIQKVHDFYWEQFKGERCYRVHTQPINGANAGNDESPKEDKSPLIKLYLDKLSSRQPEISEWGRYDWVEDIDTPELARQIKSLSTTDLEFLTCMVVDNMKRADIARKMSISRAAVTKRIDRIKKILTSLNAIEARRQSRQHK